MRVAAISWCTAIVGLQVYIFRRIYDDLIKNHMEGPKGFRALLTSWVAEGRCQIVQDEIRFWNGSKIFLCHCAHPNDVYKYQGAEMHVLMIDELTHFTETMYRFLRGRNRMVGIKVPAKYEGFFPRILCGANPGNIGHLWVKNAFIIGAPPAKMRRMSASEGGMRRQFIPARLEDNPSLMVDDPTYESRLEGLGSAALVKAMRWGDWNVIEGAFFDCWSEKLVISPFAIPAGWLRYRSVDWGSASPFSVGWWAVVQDDYFLSAAAGGNEGAVQSDASANSRMARWRRRTRAAKRNAAVYLPRGSLVRYREDYGDRDGAVAVGLKLTAEQFADRIVAFERDLADDQKPQYGVMDPSAFDVDGGPSIAERINTRLLKFKLAPFTKADNRRVRRPGVGSDRRGPMSGWDQMRARMIGENSRPLIYCFETCLDSIRTIPVLQHDPDKAEDLNTHMEDHAADEWRYACMARPWLRSEIVPEEPPDAYAPPAEMIPDDSIKIL